MANAYDELKSERENAAFYTRDLKQILQAEEQNKRRRKIVEDITKGIKNDDERERVINETINNPRLYVDVVSNYLKKLDEKSKKGENLEAIVNSAPLESLGTALSYIPPSKDVSKGYSQINLYNKVLFLSRGIKEAKDENNFEALKQLTGAMKGVVAEYILSPDYCEDKETTEFLKKFVGVMSEEHVNNVYSNLVKKASEYLSSDKNSNEIRGYTKNVLRNEKLRPIFYDAVVGIAA